MIIENVQFNCDLIDMLTELISQLRANGIPLIQKYVDNGSHIQICCPYHKDGMERRPSAGLRKSDGLFHCFACGEVHSFAELVSHCFGRDDAGVFGWQWMLKNFVSVERNSRPDIELSFDRSHGLTPVRKYVSEEELDSYRYIHPYMYKRGLTDAVIEMFDIGYDKDTDCITFPVRDIDGNTLFVARRSVKTKYFNYPKGAEKPLYGLYEYMKYFNGSQEPVIVCESMLDALSFWTIGKPAVALNGLGNELQFKQIRELRQRNIILATDMDERGLDARERIRKALYNKIIYEYFFPDGRKDANECTKEELMNLESYF